MAEPTKRNKIVELISAMPTDCPAGEFDQHLDVLFREMRRTLPAERAFVARALKLLGEQPEAVAALIQRYRTVPQARFQERFEILQVLGELRREEAFEPLVAIVWQPLPQRPARIRCHNLSARTCEERIRSKAVQGVVFLRTNHAYAEAERIMINHESIMVRVAAVEAYMWNKSDSREAADRLYSILPTTFHPFVERPRYYRGMDAEHFEMRTLAWMKKWAPEGKLPPNPEFLQRYGAETARSSRGL